MLVTPGSIAHLWTDRFDRMLAIAVAAATTSTATGILISYHIGASTGACIVLVQTLLFVASLAFAPKYGILQRSAGT
jgi:manganese transport system permease protein